MNRNSSALPPLKISVVTPNYNGGEFLEHTILSVVSQNYENLEYILVDGDSSDDSMQIVDRYAGHFSHIISEKDDGHADALNKGFSLATGDVLAWINSDDFLVHGSLQRVNHVFSELPGVAWLTGRPSTANESGETDPLRPLRMWSWIRFLCGDFRHIQQESTFWRRSLWQDAGSSLDTRYRLANDFELWLRFFQRTALYTVDALLGCFRIRSGQRSIAQAAEYEKECEQALEAFVDALPAALLARYFHLMPSEQLRSRRVAPAILPPNLTATDPPLITFDPNRGIPTVANFNNQDIPADFEPDISVKEDLIFDGLDRIQWSSGPHFAECDLTAAEIDISPFAPNVAVAGGLSEVSPPMVALIGPLAVSDWGNGKVTLQVSFREGTVSHDLQLAEAGSVYRVKLLLSGDRYTLILNGRTIAVEATKGPQIMQSPLLVLGGGHAQRFWVGAMQRVAVTLLARTNAGTGTNTPYTYMLTHASGTHALPRQRRVELPQLNLSSAGRAQRPTPLTAFRNRHRGQRCFLMGDGSSLNKTELEKLAGEIVFVCNAAFLLFQRVTWHPTYYTCSDPRVISDRAVEITRMLNTHPSITAFFPTQVQLQDGSETKFSGREIIPSGPNRHYFNEVANRESHHLETMFSLDADDYVVQAHTAAITMLQLAAFMGFSEIYLIGCDINYKVWESVKQEGLQTGSSGLLLTSTSDEKRKHFDPIYPGHRWESNNPLVGEIINHYRWTHLALRRTGTQVFNATAGGQLEVFQRVDLNSLFPPRPNPTPQVVAKARYKPPLLSVAIPAYDRPGPLLHTLKRFIAQIEGKYEDEIEIVVSDDCSPNDSLHLVKELAERHGFLQYRRYEANIGLEKNLLACTDSCTGEYLWIFGDDDFLETDDALDQIVELLRKGRYDVFVLNRTRRSADLSQVLSRNWMALDEDLSRPYAGLRTFCLDFGFISVLGFISTNIFRRRRFLRVNARKYMGTMYPHLGALVEAFCDRRTLLLGAPLVCHRTQTQTEKRDELGAKSSESDFMTDTQRRNATYFSHPYIAMIDELIEYGAFAPEDVLCIRENTVIDGHLIDFLIDCVHLSNELHTPTTEKQWDRTKRFFASLPLDSTRREHIDFILDNHAAPNAAIVQPSISVITPSFNQAAFLPCCLESVRDQTYPALEHLVFDPGSTDGSRDIAGSFSHVTLFAEPDTGQSDAVNKGFARARGDIICWLNSDDQLADHEVFTRVVQRFKEPDAPEIVYGKGIYIDEAGAKLRDAYINEDPGSLHWRFAQEDGIMQPALFMRRSVIERVGLLRDDLHFTMDYEYWIRCVKAGIRFSFFDSELAIARYHITNKTYGERGPSYAEICQMIKGHFGYVSHIWLKRYAEFLSEGHDGVLAHSSNAGISDKAKFQRIYRDLLIGYNGDPTAQRTLRAHQADRGYGDTLREMSSLSVTGNLEGTAPVISSATLCDPLECSSTDHFPRKGTAVGANETEKSMSEVVMRSAARMGSGGEAVPDGWKGVVAPDTLGVAPLSVAATAFDLARPPAFVVLGNGPSMRGFDFKKLANVTTIGMNAAYRYWDDIGWYPTYYACLDTVVGLSHQSEIERLVANAEQLGIRGFLLRRNLIERSQILKVSSCVYDYEDLSSKESIMGGGFVTTGSHSARFGAYLGYRMIYLLGIDCNYVEKVNEARDVEACAAEASDCALEIEATPQHNPNYFFDSYQQAGDRYNIPNANPSAPTHLNSWREAGRDLEQRGVRMLNANLLSGVDAFDFCLLEEALAGNGHVIPRDWVLGHVPEWPEEMAVGDSGSDIIGPYERKERVLFDELLFVKSLLIDCNNKGVMLDVGGHFGSSAKVFADCGWKVVSLEPDPNNRAKLLEAATAVEGIHVDDRAVERVPGKRLTFFSSPESTGISTLSPFRETHAAMAVVTTTNIEEVIRQYGLTRVDLLKIDVEGLEMEVLKGVPWGDVEPDIIVAEFENKKTRKLGYCFHDLVRFLERRGYMVLASEWHPIIRYGSRHDWHRLYYCGKRAAEEEAWGNLIAFRQPVVLDRVKAAAEKALRVEVQ